MQKQFVGPVVALAMFALAGCGRQSAGCSYPGDPGDVSTGRPATPATPATSGFPAGIGFKGTWSTAHQPVVSGAGGHDFVWQSTWRDASGADDGARASNRAIIFRLEGNPKVKITAVSGGGVVAADGRSAYSCCDASGMITVTVIAEVMASLESPNIGRLWGIDVMGGGTAAGVVAEFEVVAP